MVCTYCAKKESVKKKCLRIVCNPKKKAAINGEKWVKF